MSQKYGMLHDGGYNANVMPSAQPPYPGGGPGQGAPPPPAYQASQPTATPAPPYGQGSSPAQGSTTTQAGSTTILLQQPAPIPWKWSTTITSSLALWFCCTPMAFCGLLYAIHSYVDHKTQDYNRSNSKLRMAWICTICSIAVGVLFWVIFIASYAVLISKANQVAAGGATYHTSHVTG